MAETGAVKSANANERPASEGARELSQAYESV